MPASKSPSTTEAVKASQPPVREPDEERDSEVQFPGLLSASSATAARADAVKTHAARLSDARFPTAQRQAFAVQIGRVLGNRHLQRVVSAIRRDKGTIQREDGEEQRPTGGFQLQMPGTTPGGFGTPPSLMPGLTLDPSIQAQIRAIELTRLQLDPAAIRPQLLALDPGILTLPPTPAPGPVVPAGAGPETPREASGGDVLRAIMAVPAIDQALTTLQTQATDQVRRDWGRLSTGERVAAISAAVVIGGGAIAGVVQDPTARRFVLDQLNGRTFPVPGVTGLSLELNTSATNVTVGMHLDVGALLPSWMGFGPSSPSALGGPPSPQPYPGGQ